MVGIIKEISMNPHWSGNWAHVGDEVEVEKSRRDELESFFTGKKQETDTEAFVMEAVDFSEGFEDSSKTKEGSQAASHKIIVEFVNGATRTFASKAMVDSLELAYASTCHKCQGSQMDTAIIVVHHLSKAMLSREWFYTAVTRAVKRVVLLYTDHGVRLALANQRIFGRTLAEKIKKYKELQEETVGVLRVRPRLFIERDYQP